MKHVLQFLLMTLLIFLCHHSLPAQSSQHSNNRILVKFNTEIKFFRSESGIVQCGIFNLDELFNLHEIKDCVELFPAAGANQSLRLSLGMNMIYLIITEPGTNNNDFLSKLSLIPVVDYAEIDHFGFGMGIAASDSLIPNDTYFSRQWGFYNTGSNPVPDPGTAGADIKAIYSWTITTGDSNVIAGVLDTGLKWNHPDISNRVWTNKDEIPDNGIDDDSNGYIDDVRGWNFAYNTNNITDDYGHGTNVASILGATSNNSLGYAGLDWNCKIMVLKILNSSNWGYYSWWASALYYAANNGADVINMSVGGTDTSYTLLTAVDYAYQSGCFIAASMGNSNNSTANYPAAYDSQVVAVGATDSQDRRCNPFFWGGGSNYGSHIDVVAPGNYIYGLYHLSNTDYSWYWGGTSQAAPMVTGLAALLLAQNSSRSPFDLRTIIRATADDTVGRPSEDTQGFDNYHGYGRINCYRALTYSSSGIISLDDGVPSEFQLLNNFPNPFNPSTTFRFKIPYRSIVKLEIFNSLGQFITAIVNEEKEAGSYEVSWNASGLASGVYFDKLTSGTFFETKKLILLK